VGLDVTTVQHLSNLLEELALTQSPRIILSLRSNEHIPPWLSRFILLTEDYQIHHIGPALKLNKKLGGIIKELDTTQALSHDADAIVGPGLPPRKLDSGISDTELRLLEDSRELLKSLAKSEKRQSIREQQQVYRVHRKINSGYAWLKESPDGFPTMDIQPLKEGEPLIEMKGVRVAYGDKTVLGKWEPEGETKEPGLWWTVRRGQRWGVFGPNGSGKTTLTALISSDHPQSYSLPIAFFGRPRLPEPGKPGISFFDIQARIGFSSPELHAFFPKNISIRQALESAWADTPLSKADLTPELDDRVSAILLWFQAELCPELGMTDLQKQELYRPVHQASKPYKGQKPKPEIRDRYNQRVTEGIMLNQTLSWADVKTFGSLPFASQRVLLFLRAIIKRPDIVILDEAFSSMDPFTVQKCHTFLTHGDQKTLRLIAANKSRIGDPIARRSEIDLFGLSKFPGLSEEQALIIIAHRKEEVPGSVRQWVCLPEPGEGRPRFGKWDGPIQNHPNRWREVWDLPLYSHGSERFSSPMESRKWKRKINPARISPPRDLEARARRRLTFNREFHRSNKLRERVSYQQNRLRIHDTAFRKIKLTAEMRKPQFQKQDAVTQLLVKSELLYHDTVMAVKSVNLGLTHPSSLRIRRQDLRRRMTRRAPRSTALLSPRLVKTNEKIGIHGF
jgi:ABC-type molybdenum transport system ATPase subunit/photorepair protein PhrA